MTKKRPWFVGVQHDVYNSGVRSKNARIRVLSDRITRHGPKWALTLATRSLAVCPERTACAISPRAQAPNERHSKLGDVRWIPAARIRAENMADHGKHAHRCIDGPVADRLLEREKPCSRVSSHARWRQARQGSDDGADAAGGKRRPDAQGQAGANVMRDADVGISQPWAWQQRRAQFTNAVVHVGRRMSPPGGLRSEFFGGWQNRSLRAGLSRIWVRVRTARIIASIAGQRTLGMR